MIAEFREIIEELQNRTLVDKISVLEMLNYLTRTLAFVDQLGDFLVSEIERQKSDETMSE
jgi:hypothetical protein